MIRRPARFRSRRRSADSFRLSAEWLEYRRALSANQCLDVIDNLSSCATIPIGVRVDAGRYAARDFVPISSATKVAAANDSRIDGLNSGYKWGTRNLTYSFYAGGAYYGSESSPSPVSDAVKDNVRYILNQIIAPVIDVTFTEVPDSPTSYGLLRYLCSSSASYAYAYLPTGFDTNNGSQMDVVGDVVLNPSNDVTGADFNSRNNSFRTGPGSHGFSALIHETGHALGLKHPFESPVLPRSEENWDNTVMTYNFVGSEPATMMAYDILTLQYFYGAPAATRSGDTTYVFTSADAFTPGSGSSSAPTQSFAAMKHTLLDSGGIDTIDLSALPAVTGGYRIDVRPGGWITPTTSFNAIRYDSAGYTSTDYGTRVALSGTTLENILVSRSADTMYLNAAANRVGGYKPSVSGGADVIYGADQLDTLDLSLFSRAGVVESKVGNDLSIALGSAGSVTLKDYYAVAVASRPAILYMTPPPTAMIADAIVVEGNAGETLATFAVGLSFAPLQQVVISVATQDGTATAQAGDYYPLAAGTTVVFAPGQTTATVQVRVRGDVTFEPDETFSVVLSDPQGAIIGDGIGICTIKNDDAAPLPSISVSDARVTEGNAGTTIATVTVSLSWAVDKDVIVSYATQDGTATQSDGDYVAVPAGSQLRIPAGQAAATIALQVMGDGKAEADEWFSIVLSDPQNAVIGDGVGVCTITADDVGIASTTVVVVEGTSGARVAQIPLRLIGASSSPVTVYFQTANGTATGGVSQDYRDTRGVVTFRPGETEKRVAVSVVGDSSPEGDESFTLRVRRTPQSLSGSAAGDGEADIRVVIIDDDSRFFRIQANGAWVTAGSIASYDVTLDRSPAYGPVLPQIAGVSNPEAVTFDVRYVVGNTALKSTDRWNQPSNLDFKTGTLTFGYSTGAAGVVAVTTRRVDVATAATDKRRDLIMQLFSLDNSRQDVGIASQRIESRSRAALFRTLGGQGVGPATSR